MPGKKRLIFVLCSIVFLSFLPAAHLNSGSKTILYISGADPKEDTIQFAEIAKNVPQNCKLYYHSLHYEADSIKHLPSYEDSISTGFLEEKKFDVIITGDEISFRFLQKNRAKYAEDIPVIVIGTENNPVFEKAKTMRDSYFISDVTFARENTKLALELFPTRRKIVCIGCTKQQEAQAVKSDSKEGIEYEFKNITGMSKEQIMQYTSSLGKSSIIFLPSPKELNENLLPASQVLGAIIDSTNNPVFVCHDIGITRGVIGGYFISIPELGLTAARTLNMIFAYRNMPPSEISVTSHPNWYFDYEQVLQHKINKNFLDPKAVLINEPKTQIEQKNNTIVILLLNIILVTAVSSILFYTKNRLKIQNEWLNEERTKFNAVISQSEALFWECVFKTDAVEDENDDPFITQQEDFDANETTNIAQGWIDSGLIPEEYIRQYDMMIEEIKGGKETVSIDLPLMQKDAHTHLTNTRWKHIVYRTIKNRKGRNIRAIATATDITNKKRAEEEYEGEMSYRSFVNKEYPLYSRLNLTNNLLMERMINVPEIKFSASDNTAEGELALFVKTATNCGQNPSLPAALTRKELLTSFMNGTRSREWDFYYTSTDGIVRWYTLTAELSSNPYTSCVEATFSMREITNRKIMMIAKDSVLDEEVEYIFWLDLSNTKCHFIHRTNLNPWVPATEEIDYNNLVNLLVHEVISPKDRDTVEEFFALKNLTIRIKDKTVADCTFEILTNNLTISIKQMRAYYLTGNQNVILFICRDITDITLFEKLQNEKLSKAIEQTEKANASKSDFLSRMSHDLRTPMNGIIGMTELAEDDLDKPQEIAEDLRKIKSSSKYMLGLLNDILDMAKIESGKLEIRKSRQSVGEIFESIITMAKSMCESNGIEFSTNIDPNRTMNYYADIDRLHFQQVIMNLLSNAVKFTPKGGRIEFLIDKNERIGNTDHVEFIVRDNGSGMTAEFQKVMFEAFTQDVNSINKVGTGLGLSIVQNLVKLMNGTIECRSAPGEGTEFCIKLAFEFLEIAENEKEKAAAVNAEMTANLTGKRILLVEDNPLNQEISRRVLQKKGIVVTLAENGKAALDTFSQSPENSFDLILMDVMMPVMGGIEAAGRIRAIDRSDAKNIPIIALTANAFTEDIQKCLEAGMNSHLSKPVNPVLLIKTIAEYTG